MRQKPVLYVLILGSFISVYNTCSMNVGLPAFIDIFDSDLATVQWLMTGFTLATGVIIPLSGYLGDRFSHKQVFLYSIAGLMASSALCAVSWSIYSLIAFRILQGVFCGIIQPVTLTIIFQAIPKQQRNVALSFWSASSILGPALAPTISGWLLGHNWHWMFLVLVPVSILTLWMGVKWIPRDPPSASGPLDRLGLMYAVCGSLALLLYFGNIHQWGLWSYRSAFVLILGLASSLLFVRHELRVKAPLLHLRLFRSRIFMSSILVSAILIIGLYSGIYFVPLYLQEIHRMSPFEVGLLLLLPSLSSGAATLLAGALYPRIGAFRLVIAGAVLIVLASWQFSFLALDTNLAYVAFWMAVRYIGIGLSMTPAMNAGMHAAAAEWYSHASALINWLRQIFGALALGLFTSLFYARQNLHITVLQQSAATPSAEWIRLSAYTLGIDDSFVVAALLVLLSLPLALLLRERRRDKEGRESREEPTLTTPAQTRV
ncbi:DHA2 family efflux MFS transporter permease subunit [Paenibacillus sp. FSL W8-0186]|uniref:MFS transporter n=1 Tax=Paenibacillus woosongensis TaxID=307580 RepID=A0ABQ4MTI8_9BACL|nr:DHA2 family efflux MFS transporter permease subunit [Paenibacillus woosongensis]GIP59248.1 MFS transporter [Paenibacillus woosongensis]